MLRGFDAVHFMASVDDLETNTAFARKNDADFPVLSDADKSVARAWGVLAAGGYARRWTFYIDGDGNIAHIDKTVNTLTAAADIAARLAALGVPPATAATPTGTGD
jgi:peroxiredoxin Q/BCP